MHRLLAASLALLLLAPAAASAQFPDPCSAPCTVIAGTGDEATDEATRGDGGKAVDAAFDDVDGLDHVGDGSILVADGFDGRIRRITPAGNITTNREDLLDEPVAVVGTGWFPNHPFPHPFYVADQGGEDRVENHEVLFPHGTWRTTNVTSPDEVLNPVDVEAADGGLWIADDEGTVWLHGTGGTSAALEGLDGPRGVGDLPGAAGFLVAVSGSDCKIRRRSRTVVAGTTFCASLDAAGYGDGGPATSAPLRYPEDVEATPDGGFVFIEQFRLRRVDPAGTISTLYYGGIPGFPINPDFPPPSPTALEVLPDGDVLIGLERRILRFDTNYAPPKPPGGPGPGPGGPGNPLPPPPGGGGEPVVTPEALAAALAKASYKVKKGKKLAFSFTASAAGDWRLAIRKGKKVKKAFKGKAKAGANTVRKKIALKPGKYRVALTLAAGGETAKDSAKLRVLKR